MPGLYSFLSQPQWMLLLQNNKRLWKQLDFTTYLLRPTELHNSTMCSCTGLHPHLCWHEVHDASCVQIPWDRNLKASTWLQQLGERDRACWCRFLSPTEKCQGLTVKYWHPKEGKLGKHPCKTFASYLSPAGRWKGPGCSGLRMGTWQGAK